jgi:hypothetical protein
MMRIVGTGLRIIGGLGVFAALLAVLAYGPVVLGYGLHAVLGSHTEAVLYSALFIAWVICMNHPRFNSPKKRAS